MNRPFDDPSQEVVRREAEAVLTIIGYVRDGDVTFVSSRAVAIEIARTPSDERRAQSQGLASFAAEVVRVDTRVAERAANLQSLGFAPADALHLACAERGNVDVFLTTDLRLLRRASRLTRELRMAVRSPRDWLAEWENR